ncbi:MAG: hypothetical protein DBX53_01160 [Clostridiales bacterium]|nr:MAG: hypothetical protein DBX53_01160 [Clostridiales bacterium]
MNSRRRGTAENHIKKIPIAKLLFCRIVEWGWKKSPLTDAPCNNIFKILTRRKKTDLSAY